MLFGVALGSRDWSRAAYLLIPISAYFLGSFFSEFLPVFVRKSKILRWDTLLVGFEVLVLLFLGFLPDSAPEQISQVSINFICSMQYNTFRQAQGIPMATTFCTNHLRQTGIHLAKWLRKKDKTAPKRISRHIEMLFSFIVGSFIGTWACHFFTGRAIWGAAFLMFLAFLDLLHADLTNEKDKLSQVPSGH
jgi:uncharacterized membrane protein YoaK (UPF0700 family)